MPEQVRPILVDAPEAARLLGMSVATLWRRVRDGALPKPIKIKGISRWRIADLEHAVERLASTSR